MLIGIPQIPALLTWHRIDTVHDVIVDDIQPEYCPKIENHEWALDSLKVFVACLQHQAILASASLVYVLCAVSNTLRSASARINSSHSIRLLSTSTSHKNMVLSVPLTVFWVDVRCSSERRTVQRGKRTACCRCCPQRRWWQRKRMGRWMRMFCPPEMVRTIYGNSKRTYDGEQSKEQEPIQ